MQKYLKLSICLVLGSVLLSACGALDNIYREYVTYGEVAALRVGVTKASVTKAFVASPKFAWTITHEGQKYQVRLYMVRKGYYCINEENFASHDSPLTCSAEENPRCVLGCKEPSVPERRLMLVYLQGAHEDTLWSWGWVDHYRYTRVGGKAIGNSFALTVSKSLEERGCSPHQSLSECVR